MAFVRYAGERAAKTVAQVAVALLVGGQTGIIGIDWTNVGSVAALAALTSILTSVIAQTGTAQDADPTPQGETVAPEQAPEVPKVPLGFSAPSGSDS